MPYLFGALVLANLGLFGCYFVKPPSHDGSYLAEKAKLDKPMHYINSTNELPPLIGEK